MQRRAVGQAARAKAEQDAAVASATAEVAAARDVLASRVAGLTTELEVARASASSSALALGAGSPRGGPVMERRASAVVIYSPSVEMLEGEPGVLMWSLPRGMDVLWHERLAFSGDSYDEDRDGAYAMIDGEAGFSHRLGLGAPVRCITLGGEDERIVVFIVDGRPLRAAQFYRFRREYCDHSGVSVDWEVVCMPALEVVSRGATLLRFLHMTPPSLGATEASASGGGCESSKSTEAPVKHEVRSPASKRGDEEVKERDECLTPLPKGDGKEAHMGGSPTSKDDKEDGWEARELFGKLKKSSAYSYPEPTTSRTEVDRKSTFRTEIAVKRAHGWAQDTSHEQVRFFRTIDPTHKWDENLGKALQNVRWESLTPPSALRDHSGTGTQGERSSAYYKWEATYVRALRHCNEIGVAPLSVLMEMRDKARLVSDQPGESPVVDVITRLEKDGAMWGSCELKAKGRIWGDVAMLYDLFVVLMRKHYPSPGRAREFNKAYDMWAPDWRNNIEVNVNRFEKAYVEKENPKSRPDGVQMDTIYETNGCRNMVDKFVQAYETDKNKLSQGDASIPAHAELMFVMIQESLADIGERVDADAASTLELNLATLAKGSWVKKEREFQAQTRLSTGLKQPVGAVGGSSYAPPQAQGVPPMGGYVPPTGGYSAPPPQMGAKATGGERKLQARIAARLENKRDTKHGDAQLTPTQLQVAYFALDDLQTQNKATQAKDVATQRTYEHRYQTHMAYVDMHPSMLASGYGATEQLQMTALAALVSAPPPAKAPKAPIAAVGTQGYQAPPPSYRAPPPYMGATYGQSGGGGDQRPPTDKPTGTRRLIYPKGVQLGTTEATDFFECEINIREYDQLCATPGPASTWLRDNGIRPSAQFEHGNPPPVRTQSVDKVPSPHNPNNMMWPRHTCAKCHFGLRLLTSVDPYLGEPYKYAEAQQDGGHREGICNAVKAEIWLSPLQEVRRLLKKKDGTRPRDIVLGTVPPGLRP